LPVLCLRIAGGLFWNRDEERDRLITKKHANARFRVLTSLVLIFLFLALAVACPSCGTPSFTSEQQQEIEREIGKVMSENDIPGAVVGIWVPGEGTLILERGKADIETGRAPTRTDQFRIGSNTKTFTNTVLLQLVDEGKVALDDTLDRYFPDVPNSNNITIRELCNMTSGLANYSDDDGFQEAMEDDPFRKWKPGELVEIAISLDPYFPPGQGFHYSNTNTVLLGMIIEQVTGNAVRAEIRQRIIKPLGLESTTFPTGPDMTGEYSRGYYADEDSGELVDVTNSYDPSWAWTAGAMVSELVDMKTWVEALGNGELLSRSTQDERLKWTDTNLEDVPLKYGLGIMSVDGFLGHAGDLPGFSSAAFYLPSKDATIVVWLNKEPSDKAAIALRLMMSIGEVLFPNEVPR